MNQLRRTNGSRLLVLASSISLFISSVFLIAAPVLATPPDPVGNNGTVKIHEASTEQEPIVANDPHVCTFHLHFFFGDDVQAGDWWIKSWPPTGDGTTVLDGTYDAVGGEDRQPAAPDVYSLPDGHYKLFWEGATNPGNQLNIKHKVFWVECEPEEPEEPKAADVTIAKSASKSEVDAGESFRYTLVVSNIGEGTAENVVVDDNTLDLPLTFSEPVASQGTCSLSTSNNLHCDLGDIDAGDEVTITFQAQTTDEACPEARNSATVDAENDSNDANNHSNVVTVVVNCEAEPTPPDDDDDDAALNIRKIDEDGNRLAGAVFTVEGIEGTFTTGENGHFCITGLPEDSEWLVTEVQAPDGYEIADEASQTVKVDNDGDCNSPDAEFVNTLAQMVEPTPTPTPGDSEPPSHATPTPRDGVEGGNPTAMPKGNTIPDTAMSTDAAPWIPGVAFALIAIASLGMLARLRLAESGSRR